MKQMNKVKMKNFNGFRLLKQVKMIHVHKILFIVLVKVLIVLLLSIL